MLKQLWMFLLFMWPWMVRSVLVLYGAGSAGLVHRGGTETESRGASRDMDPAWGHGEGRKKKKTAVPQILAAATEGIGGARRPNIPAHSFCPEGRLRIHVVITRFPGGQTVQTRLLTFTDLWSFQADVADPFKGVETHFTFTRVISDGGQRLVWLPEFLFFFFFLCGRSHRCPQATKKKALNTSGLVWVKELLTTATSHYFIECHHVCLFFWLFLFFKKESF